MPTPPPLPPVSPVPHRTVEVAPERVERWVDGFGERHGGVRVVRGEDGRVASLVGGDGTTAAFAWFAFDTVGVVLVRRGGYAVALVRRQGSEVEGGAQLVAHKVGTRHVQSRTAAGGWSQQRFARRRDNQADALVEAVAGHALQVVLGGDESPAGGSGVVPDALVVGGDRTLVAAVLDEPVLRALRGLPRRELYDLPDPKRAVLDQAVRRGRAVRVTVTDP